MAGVIRKDMHDEPETVTAVRDQQVKKVSMRVFAGVTMVTVNGYPHVIRVVALKIFRSDVVSYVSYRRLAAIRAATALTFECVWEEEALGMLYHISFGIIRGDRGFKVKKA